MNTFMENKNKIKINKEERFYKNFLAVTLVVSLFFGMNSQLVHAEWTGPSGSPLSSTVPPPLTNGPVDQAKYVNPSYPSYGLVGGGILGILNTIGVRLDAFVRDQLTVNSSTPGEHTLSVRGDVKVTDLADLSVTPEDPNSVCADEDGVLVWCDPLAEPTDPPPSGTETFDNSNPVNPPDGFAEDARYLWTVPDDITQIVVEVWGGGGTNIGSHGIPTDHFTSVVRPDGRNTGVRFPTTSSLLCASGAGAYDEPGTSNGYVIINGELGGDPIPADSENGKGGDGAHGGAGGSAGIASILSSVLRVAIGNGFTPGGGTGGFEYPSRDDIHGGAGGGYGRGVIAVNPGDVFDIIVGGSVREPKLYLSEQPLGTTFSAGPYMYQGGFSGAGRVRIHYGDNAIPLLTSGYISGLALIAMCPSF